MGQRMAKFLGMAVVHGCMFSLCAGLLACSGKESGHELILKGRLSVPAEVQGGTLLVGVSGQPFEQLANDPLTKTMKFIATRDFTSYEMRLSESDLAKIDTLQVYGLLHRDAGLSQVPTLAKNDLFGFFAVGTRPGLGLSDRSSKTYYADLTVNRVYQGKSVKIPIEIADDKTGSFVAGVYCGDIQSTSPKQFNLSNVAAVKSMQKTQPVQGDTLEFPVMQVNQTDYCYLFAFNDQNNNQSLDQGERFGFYSDRKDGLPTQFNLNEPVTSPLRLTLASTVAAPRAQPIVVKGSLTISSDLKASTKRFFVIATKQQDMTLNVDQVAKNVLAFKHVDASASDYDLDLTDTAVNIGDKVTVFAIGDNSDRGFPSLANGDGLGLAIDDNTLVTKAVQPGVNAGFNIDMKQRYHDGGATIHVSVDSDYTGPMVLYAYAGPLGLDATSLDSSKVVGLVSFDKTEQKVQADLNVFAIGQSWPMQIYVVGLLDANHNQKPDPGETLQLPLDSHGAPIKLTVNNGDKLTSSLNYLYNLQIPGNQNMILSGNFAFSSAVSSPYVTMLVAQGDSIDAITADPLKYVRAVQKVPAAAKHYQISLAKTALKAGEKVYIIGITSDGTSDFPVINAESLLGIYSKGQDVGYVLQPGNNPHLDLVIDRAEYKDKIAVSGSLDDDYRGPVFAMLYGGSPLDLVGQNIRSSAVLAFSQFNKVTDHFSVDFKTLLTNQKLPTQGIPILLEDSNGNNRGDPGERVFYAFDPNTNGPLSLQIAPGTVQNFAFDRERVLPAPSSDPLLITGKVAVGSKVGSGHLYLLVLDGGLASLSGEEMADHIQVVQELPSAGGAYEVDLTNTGLRAGDKVLVMGLIDRNPHPNGFPQLSKDDLVGVYTGHNGLMQRLSPGRNSGIDLIIDRPVFDGQAKVSGRIIGQTSADLVIAAYTGAIDSLTAINLDYAKVVGYTKAAAGVDAYYEMIVSPLGQAFPMSTYIIAFADSNGNQTLDPGETVYFYSTRPDKVPEKVTLNQGQGLSLDLNQFLTLQVPANHPMPLSGHINWLGSDAADRSPAYLFVAKGSSFDALRNDPLHTMKYLQKLSGQPTSFALSLEATDLVPSDKVIVGVLLDKDGSLSPTTGDRIGIVFTGLSSFNVTLAEGGQSGLTIDVNSTIYNTQKSIDATFSGSSYAGRVIAFLYTGAFESLDFNAIDKTKVVGYSDLQKSADQSAFSLPLLPIANLPISNATLIAFLDANGNGNPDPGEWIGFASAKPSGLPATFSITSDSTATLVVNSFYQLPKPSGQQITAGGTLSSVFPLDTSTNPVAVSLFAETDFSSLAKEPLKYLKSFTTLKAGATSFNVDLSQTDLKAGDRVVALAYQNGPQAGSGAPVQLREGSYVGLLLNGNTLDMALPLALGANALDQNGYALQLNRIFYQHDGRIDVSVGNTLGLLSTGDPLILAAYHIDTSSGNAATILAQLTTIDYSKVIAYYKTTFQANKTYSMPIFPAITPGLVDTNARKVASVVVVAFRDSNGNGKLDNGETYGVYSSSTLSPVSIIDVSLGVNQLTGSIAVGAVMAAGSGGLSIPTTIP